LKYLLALILIITYSCNTLEPQDMYCEIAFAYPDTDPLPDDLYKELIGCACTTKDILKGVEIGAWTLHPLEDCRRVRGFSPYKWKDVIDPYFQKESAKVK
jgi:hypothetical protein